MTKEKIEKPTQFVEAQAGPIASTKTKTRVRAKIIVKAKVRKSLPAKVNDTSSSTQTFTPLPISEQIPELAEEAPNIEGYEVKAEQSPSMATEEAFELERKSQLTAQELLDKPLHELEKDLGKREAQNMLKSMKIVTAIMLGKNKNKELAQVLDTDKSFTSKQIKELEEQGLVTREGEGKETTYSVDRFNLMKFLESKIVVKWGKGKPKETNAQKEKAEDNKNG
jgi:DNA-binding transcriptional ArsR family regulator